MALPLRRESWVWARALLMAPAQGRHMHSCTQGLRALPVLRLLALMPRPRRLTRAQKVCGERSA